MMTFEEQVVQAEKAVVNAEKRLSNLLEKCDHRNTTKKQHYSGGGYDYCGETRYWDECTVCHAQLNEHYVSTGRYG